MILKAEAHKIYEIFALKENQSLTNDEQLTLIEKQITEIYNKGKRIGHLKAVALCKSALDAVVNANSNIY